MTIQLGGRGSVRDRGRGGRNKEIPQRDETSVIDGDCSGHLSHCIKHHQFNCVNMAPGSTEAIHYVAEPLSPAEATQILLDHISPAALPSVKNSSLSHCITSVATDIVVLFFLAPLIHHGDEENRRCGCC